MKQFFKICKETGALGGWICLFVAIFLLVGAALVPPLFVIDSSILAGVGELFAFSTLFKLPNIIESIERGKSIKLQHNNTTIEVKGEEDNG